MDDQSSFTARLSFGIATSFTGYLIWRCLKAPNEPHQVAGESVRDTLASTPFFFVNALYRTAFLALTTWQGLVCIDRSFAPPPSPHFPMNQRLFTWNALSVTVFPIIWMGALVRIQAFEQLGKKFTFELREPDRLKTDGLYKYVQHPSYSGGFVAIVGAPFWFFRCDGVMATVLPKVILQYGPVLNWVMPAAVLLAAIVGIPLRVVEEERMLKKTFGKEWELWHAQTARFVPYLF